MKKTYLFCLLLAAAALGGCFEQDTEIPAAGGGRLDVTIRADETRTAYDGAGHVNWHAADRIAVAAAPAADATEPTDYYAEFPIGDDLENPRFTGSVKAIDGVEEYVLYGIYPYAALTSKYYKKVVGIEVTLPKVQHPTQSSYDGDADIMVAAPDRVATQDGTLGVTMRFAHLFGFARLSFDAPAYARELVKRVTMTATGDAKDLAGDFSVDLTLPAGDPANALRPTSYTKVSEVVLQYDGTVALADLAAWFVLNPGTYDVRIAVKTDAHVLTFERSGLHIKRAAIAEPTLTFRGADTAEQTAVTLDGAMWRHDFDESYRTHANFGQFFVGSSVGSLAAELGSLAPMPRMEWVLSYGSGTNTADYTTYENRKINRLSSMYIPVSDGVRLMSDAPFRGVSSVRVNGGIYSSGGAACDLSLYMNEEGVRRQVGSTQRVASASNYIGADYLFETGDPTASGALELVWENCPTTGSYYVYLASVTINQAPVITLERSAVKLKSTAAASGTIGCTTAYASGDPTVASDADWLTVCYADGAIRYEAGENTAADERTARITVTADGLTTVRETVAVTQPGTASPVITTYRVKITSSDITSVWSTSPQDYDPFTATACDVDDPAHTLTIGYLAATDAIVSGANSFSLKGASTGAGTITCHDTLERILSVSVTTSAYSTSYFRIFVGQKSTSMQEVTPVKTNSVSPYVYTYTAQDSDRLGFFRVTGASNSYYTSWIENIEIVFEVEE